MEQQQIMHLAIAISFWSIGFGLFGRLIRPRWKVPGKAIFYLGSSYLLSMWIGHYSLIFIIGHPMIGVIWHFWLCKKHNINWLTVEPREKYLRLQTEWAQKRFANKS